MLLTLVVSRKNVTLTVVVKILLVLPTGISPGILQATIKWEVNHLNLKEPLPTSGGTLGLHKSLVENVSYRAIYFILHAAVSGFLAIINTKYGNQGF